MMNRLKKYIGFLLWGSLSVLAIGGVFLYGMGFRPNIVLSGSMEPAIRTGAVCIVNTRAGYDEIQKGDVIAFRQGNTQVTHRVVAVTPEGMETKGDNNDVSDGVTTTEENYLGKTVWSVPYLGYAFQFILSARGRIIFITIIAAMLVWILFGGRRETERSSL